MRLLVLAIDGRGLGHLNRTLLLADALRAAEPAAEIRFLVESPAHGLVRQAGYPVLKLPDPMHPAARQTLEGRRAELEADLLEAVLDSWRPDGLLLDFVVDPVLFRLVKRRGLRLLLVMRKLRAGALRELAADPAADLVDAFILPHDPEELAPDELPVHLRPRCHFTGPLVRRLRVERAPAVRRRIAPDAEQLVVVSLGGGGWPGAADLAEAAYRALERLVARRPGLEAVIVHGPLYPRPLPADAPGLRALRFERELPELMLAADAVVCSAGYNSVQELVATGTPGILVPLGDPGRDDQHARAAWAHRTGRIAVAGPDPDELVPAIEEQLRLGAGIRSKPLEGSEGAIAGSLLARMLSGSFV